jgi:hypothetical protein
LRWSASTGRTNVYVPQLQYATGLVSYIHRQLGMPVASTAALAPVSEAFTRSVRAFAAGGGIPWVDFAKGQRKDDVAREFLAGFTGTEGVLFIGRAQEKVSLFRTRKRRRADGSSYPWIAAETGVVNQFYCYCVDEDFGPFFLKFCSYFPFNTTRVAGLHLTDPRAQALLHILLIFRLHPGGFLNKDLRALLGEYLGRPPHGPGSITPGQATYDLRRLREHGLIERIPHTHRYQVTPAGLRHAMFLTRVHDRILQTGLAELTGPNRPPCAKPPPSTRPPSTTSPGGQEWQPDQPGPNLTQSRRLRRP